MSFRLLGEPQEDKRLRQMILVSAILHVLVIMWVLTSSSLSRSLQPRAVAYTVELVSPEKLGSNLPGGEKGASSEEKTIPYQKASSLPPVSRERSQPKIVGQEKLKSPPLSQRKEANKMQEKEAPAEKPLVKAEPEKEKIVEKKSELRQKKPNPEPQKVARAVEQKANVKTITPPPESKKSEPKPVEPEKISSPKEVEKKKFEPQKTSTKPEKTEPTSETIEAKSEKPVAKSEETQVLTKTEVKKTADKPANEEIAADARDQQIAAALARIKAQTQAQGRSSFSEEMKGTGPVTKGGEFGEGGGGVVRGIEFLIYTQQLQKRVQENWIVAEKKPGLVASVSFMIDPNGNVQEVELTQSSGDRVFDQSVVRAIRKAAPFPPPPQLYVQEFATQKIFMNFGGEGRVN